MNNPTAIDVFLQSALGGRDYRYQAITSDASFRRYFRVWQGQHAWVLMQSPTDKLDNAVFVELTQHFAQHGLNVPKIIAEDSSNGLLLLQDLGTEHLADRLELDSVNADYKALLQQIPAIAKTPHHPLMKPYDADFIAMELDIFRHWLVEKWLGSELSPYQQVQWQQLSESLVKLMLQQPQVTMHRDFHSRNVIWHQQRWFLIDYQDAVTGPVTYDAVSLLRDCYTRLPAEQFAQLQQYSYQLLQDAQLLADMTYQEYQFYFDITGIQRHLKAAGIFTRLLQRDGKAGYLDNIQPTLQYILDVSQKHESFQWLASWIENDIMPKVAAKLTQIKR